MAKEPIHKNGTNRAKDRSMSWAEACRDMIVAAIDRGQLPTFGILIVVVTLLAKMSESDVAKLVFSIFESLRNFELFAYIFSFMLCTGWFVHAKTMRKLFSAEAERIGREKSELQSKLAQVTFESSEES